MLTRFIITSIKYKINRDFSDIFEQLQKRFTNGDGK